jgi:protein phosphatase
MARLDLFARTEVGCARERNEDAFSVVNLGTQQVGLTSNRRYELNGGAMVLCVCDGMGGAAAGDVASRIACDTMVQTLLAAPPAADHGSIHNALLHGIGAANRAIAAHAEAYPEKRGMGSTMTTAYVGGAEAHLVHIGDSRAYLRRGRSLTQLTTDHSMVGQMIANGQLTPEQARTYEHRNVLLQALGVMPSITPEVSVVQLRAGDSLMLCSDGLTGPLADPEIVAVMARYDDPVRCCRALTERACQLQAGDNVTVAVARIVGEGVPLPQGREPVAVTRQSYTI